MTYQISDEEILNLIKTGVICYSEINGAISKFHFHHQRWMKLVVGFHYKSGRAYYHIRIGTDRQRTIYRNKLMWMIKNKKLVPDWADIDHKDRNRLNDDPSNLRLLEKSVNRRSNELDEAFNFFNEIIAQQTGSQGDF